MMLLDGQDIPTIDAQVSDFITPDKEYNQTLINCLVPNDICKLIKSIHIPSHDDEDYFCWGLSNNCFLLLN